MFAIDSNGIFFFVIVKFASAARDARLEQSLSDLYSGLSGQAATSW